MSQEGIKFPVPSYLYLLDNAPGSDGLHVSMDQAQKKAGGPTEPAGPAEPAPQG